MSPNTTYQKTGYLNSDFRLFYLTSAEARDFQTHYHDFHKLLFFESGHASYYIEGETYELQPEDLVLVPAGEVHRPIFHDNSPYRRLILYLSPDFFHKYSARSCDLFQCFSLCSQRRSHVLRIRKLRDSRLYPCLQELIRTASEGKTNLQEQTDSMLSLYQEAVLLKFLILLNKAAAGSNISYPAASGSNPQILRVISYINEHLREELPVDRIARDCYLNRSYLMHLFRQETGYTLGSYITEKRLFTARPLIQSGVSVTEAAERSGFSSYTTFYRAYRKKFGEAPKMSRSG
ncbi:MAG: AraC family transcriptional regulator [Lachnospiraceae bacterium]|nr:AraC family transcriptional regulator [Lachnospiraceae bacterium]